ncbi:hypothetical protein [Montanilutibacter psychrotolerans]|uniref:Uncharacterized protein n=1 Tax=Montanilutibacter psychrotolerans TaxID=1327343 RepID=A0A3M8SMB8_9GAMM|nr:hypothetical protein [Lysobacter psychrotolerans]RNF82369.1 hypothetical protein EER27_14560 [Lysobacter psychrotolerans]
MACFPKIDKPCPLDIDAQRRLDGYCGHCSTEVHSLDAMDDAQRRALLQAASGPICVSYRTAARRPPPHRVAGYGLAIAATLVSGAAMANPPTPQTAQTPVAQASLLSQDPEQLEVVIVGGVSDPQDAGWVDDGSTPELPQLTGEALREEIAQAQDLEQVVVIGGGISDPGNAEWVDDSDLPALPTEPAGR